MINNNIAIINIQDAQAKEKSLFFCDIISISHSWLDTVRKPLAVYEIADLFFYLFITYWFIIHII